jgi:hypothetical protein
MHLAQSTHFFPLLLSVGFSIETLFLIDEKLARYGKISQHEYPWCVICLFPNIWTGLDEDGSTKFS